MCYEPIYQKGPNPTFLCLNFYNEIEGFGVREGLDDCEIRNFPILRSRDYR